MFLFILLLVTLTDCTEACRSSVPASNMVNQGDLKHCLGLTSSESSVAQTLCVWSALCLYHPCWKNRKVWCYFNVERYTKRWVFLRGSVESTNALRKPMETSRCVMTLLTKDVVGLSVPSPLIDATCAAVLCCGDSGTSGQRLTTST